MIVEFKEYFTEAAYLVASVLFILGIRDLSSAETARRGNFLAQIGMFLAIVGTLLNQEIVKFEWIIAGMVIGSLTGAVMAIFMPMTAMPERIAIVNGLGGAASCLVGISEYYRHPIDLFVNDPFKMGVVGFEVMLGALTFTGSMIAFGKLRGLVSSSPVTYKRQNAVNISWAVLMLALIACLVYAPSQAVLFYLLLVMAISFGVMFVLPIGGADMPVVIAMLNAYSGLAAAATGFVLDNKVLIIAGALDGSSGLLLSILMCRAMNRSIVNVLFGAVGQVIRPSGQPAKTSDREPNKITGEEAAEMLARAKSVIVTPGYGMAAAGAQFAVRELADLLKANGATVKYAIHPVAGRMPGHMNVLLADANVPYNELVEMDEINPQFPETDVVLVMGANDVVNPAARDSEGSPIYGMPILNVDQAKSVIGIKRSMSPGFAGIDNELFLMPHTHMFFGDGKAAAEKLVEILKQKET